MAYQITRTHQGRTAMLKNGIDRRPHIFETAERAQLFADSCFANARCDWKNQGRRLPIYKVVCVEQTP